MVQGTDPKSQNRETCQRVFAIVPTCSAGRPELPFDLLHALQNWPRKIGLNLKTASEFFETDAKKVGHESGNTETGCSESV